MFIHLINRNKKELIPVVIVNLVWLVVVLVILITSTQDKPEIKPEVGPNNTNLSTTPTPPKTGYSIRPIHFRNGSASLDFYLDQSGDKNVLSMNMRFLDGGIVRLKDKDLELKDYDSEIWSSGVQDEKYIDYLKKQMWDQKENHQFASVSPNESAFAIYLPGKLYLAKYKVAKEIDSHLKLEVMTISSLVEIELNEYSDNFSNNIQVFFSSDSEKLYVNNNNYGSTGYYVVDVNLGTSKFIASLSSRQLFPQSVGSGIVYWGKPTEKDDPKYITYEENGVQETYEIKRNPANVGGMDYPGVIIPNISGDKLCFEWGASGYWGYSVGKISGETIELIDSGEQYSYCERWISRDEVVVTSNPYHDQTVIITSLLNTNTGEMTELVVRENEEFTKKN